MTALITRFGRAGITAESVELEVRYDFLIRNDPAIRVVVRFRPGVSLDRAMADRIESSFAEVPLKITVGGKIYASGPLHPIVPAAEPPDVGADGSSTDDDELTDEDEQYLTMLVIAFAVLACLIIVLTIRARRRNRKALGSVLATPVANWGDATDDFTHTPAPLKSGSRRTDGHVDVRLRDPGQESMQQVGGHYYPGGTTFNANPIDADYLAFNDDGNRPSSPGAPKYMDPAATIITTTSMAAPGTTWHGTPFANADIM